MLRCLFIRTKKENLALKDLPVNAITPAVARKWQNDLLNDEADYSPTYIKTINNPLSAIFNFAKRYYGLQVNPAAVAGSVGKKNAEAMQFWTQDEFQCFAAAISDKPASFAVLTLYSGPACVPVSSSLLR